MEEKSWGEEPHRKEMEPTVWQGDAGCMRIQEHPCARAVSWMQGMRASVQYPKTLIPHKKALFQMSFASSLLRVGPREPLTKSLTPFKLATLPFARKTGLRLSTSRQRFWLKRLHCVAFLACDFLTVITGGWFFSGGIAIEVLCPNILT